MTDFRFAQSNDDGRVASSSATQKDAIRGARDAARTPSGFEPRLAADVRAEATHLWLLRTDRGNDRAAAEWAALLSPEERARNDRFADPGARRSHLAGKALVRSVLSRYAPTRPQDWRFVSNAYGRPSVANDDIGWDLRFNLSHADGVVALVVAAGCDIGVDVETLDRRLNVDELTPMVCAAEEAAVLATASPERRRRLFLDAWTLKEAYLKARGVGLSGRMTDCVFDLAATLGEEDFGALRLDCRPPWRFVRRRPTARHVLAIARNGEWGGLQTFEALPG